ncbi:MAG: ABC transporter ATP-binding protein [Rhizobiales bacterium]|nr:ABC transporter ATP-binding protein [Hyphomicrobiales bacterium]
MIIGRPTRTRRSSASTPGSRADRRDAALRWRPTENEGSLPLTTHPKLRVKALSKSYANFVALADASFDMREGEFLTLLGPSGSGKTTLLSLIAGLAAPSSGEIWIDGRNATHVPSKARDLGLVFQNYALFPHLSVFENIAFPLRMRRRSQADIRQAVGDVLKIVQLEAFSERLPAELSGGQQQRVALARCFVYQPSIILMDEPLGALDKKLREHMQREIRRLSREVGASVIYVTHDQEEALVMSDRICLVNKGRLEQIGAPSDLYFTPQTLFAANFIGESNLLDVEALSADTVSRHGATLRCRTPVPIAGRRATLVVRPESLKLLGPDEPAENIIEATVEDAVLTGPLTRVTARDGRGDLLVAVAPSRLGGLALAPGTSVRLGFDARSAVALAAEGAPS